MVRTVDTGDATKYRCEECGKMFDDEEAADSHEADCFVPPSM